MIARFQSASRTKASGELKFYKQYLDRESFFGHFLLNFIVFFDSCSRSMKLNESVLVMSCLYWISTFLGSLGLESYLGINWLGPYS